jgi:hypothetical protein
LLEEIDVKAVDYNKEIIRNNNDSQNESDVNPNTIQVDSMSAKWNSVSKIQFIPKLINN